MNEYLIMIGLSGHFFTGPTWLVASITSNLTPNLYVTHIVPVMKFTNIRPGKQNPNKIPVSTSV